MSGPSPTSVEGAAALGRTAHVEAALGRITRVESAKEAARTALAAASANQRWGTAAYLADFLDDVGRVGGAAGRAASDATGGATAEDRKTRVLVAVPGVRRLQRAAIAAPPDIGGRELSLRLWELVSSDLTRRPPANIHDAADLSIGDVVRVGDTLVVRLIA